MGEEDEGVDAQKLKRIAAASYDYERDPRWADYWSNILIPPNMASRSDVVDHFKRKFYQRYIDPGLIVEPMSSTGTSTRTSGSGTSTTPSPGPAPTAMRWDKQTIQFSVNAWVFVLALLSTLPLIPANLSNRAFRLSLLGTACSSLYSLYSLYGTPRAWNMQAVQMWLQSILATKDFIYFIYSLMFVTSNYCLRFALIPILCRSLEHVAKFLRHWVQPSSLSLLTLNLADKDSERQRKYLEELCVWVESNVTTLSILSSHAEVGLGFLLIISLFSWQRNFIQIFMYWQLLKLMYHAPVTAGYHQSVWTKIGRSVSPVIHRYAPFLDTPISVIQRWWLR
uniref:Transmembrane protein 33 homolog n=1 Tax=Chenopodium quinoa TaxID=63459 RepID=A0A803LKQ3_CHEQI